MPETLTELVAKITTDAAGLKSGLSDAEKQTEASSKRMQDSLRKVGMAMAASGAAITAALGLMGKAALDEDINIKRLATTINNSGTAYDNVKDSLEAVIAATQRKTGVADDEQRNILNRLILVTNDYGKALELLPTVLDLAAAGEMDATTAATYLGKAFLELEDGAEEVSVRFGQASLQFKNMEDIQNRVAGAAENLANPLSVLKASMGDVAESLGANLIPLIKDAVNVIVDVAIKVQEWAAAHPELAKTLTLIALGVGVVLTVVGGLILAMPVITGLVAAFGVVLHAALGPIGLVSLAIMALIAGIILVVKNWDKISRLWASDTEKRRRDLESLTKTVKEEFQKQANEIQSSFNTQRTESKKAYDAAVEAINKEYGIGEAAKDVSETKIEAAKRASEELKEQYKREQDAAKDRYDSEMESVRALYSERLKTLNLETDATVKALEEQITAIDRQTAAEELALQREEEAKKLATLSGAEYDEFAAEVARRELIRTRNEEKDALRDQIAEARERAETRAEQIQIEEEAELSKLKTTYEAEILNYEQLSLAADTNLKDELGRIEIDRLAKLDAEQQKLDAELDRLATTESAEIEFLANRLSGTEQNIKDINGAYDSLTKRYDIEIVTHEITVSDSRSHAGTTSRATAGIPGFASGGIVPGVIGAPQLAVVHGGETIMPVNEGGGGVVINFTEPVFFDREDTMNRFVDKIDQTLQRKYRLSGRR